MRGLMLAVLVMIVMACEAKRVTAGTVPPVYNLKAQVMPMFGDLVSGGQGGGPGQGRLGLVGDSIASNHPYRKWLTGSFVGEYGSAGYGYNGISAQFKWTLPDGSVPCKIAFLGDLNDLQKSTITGARSGAYGLWSPNGYYTRIVDDGSTGEGYVKLTVPAGYAAKLHYHRWPGAGVLGVDRPNAAGFDLSVPTAGALGDGVISLPAGTQYALSAVSGTVQVNGLELTDGTGFVLDSLARGGVGPVDFNRANNASTASVYTGLGLDLLIVMFDWGSDSEKASYKADLGAYLDFVAGAVPGLPVILVSHHAIKDDKADEAVWMMEVAEARGLGFIDHFFLFTHEELVAQGLVQPDGKHLSDAGGKWFAEYDAARMREARDE